MFTDDRILQNYTAARLRFFTFFGGLIIESFFHDKSAKNMVKKIKNFIKFQKLFYFLNSTVYIQNINSNWFTNFNNFDRRWSNVVNP